MLNRLASRFRSPDLDADDDDAPHPECQLPPATARRVAVHEAGRALVTAALRPGALLTVAMPWMTAPSPGIRVRPLDSLPTADMLLVQVKIALAGKVAEALLLGVAGMDHGGGEGSNLANATITVVRLLTNGGFGARLTWTGAVTPATVGMLLRSDPVLAAEVERTLRVQFVSTHRLLARCHGALETVAGLLEQHGVVNGAIVERILATPIEGGIQ